MAPSPAFTEGSLQSDRRPFRFDDKVSNEEPVGRRYPGPENAVLDEDNPFIQGRVVHIE